MDLPVNAIVECADMVGAHSTAVILNPATNQITHVVVREPGLIGVEHLVPVQFITESTPQHITLSCSLNELEAMPTFTLADFLPTLPGFVGYPGEAATMGPYGVMDSDVIMFEHENIPAGDVALHRWASVHATDGVAGRVDEFLFDSRTGKISHLVLREGHLWGRRDICIPIAQVDHVDAEAVYLKLSRHEIAALPVIVMANSKAPAGR